MPRCSAARLQGQANLTGVAQWPEGLMDYRGSKGMMVAEQVLQKPAMQELALFSFIVSPTGKQLKIRLDKVGAPDGWHCKDNNASQLSAALRLAHAWGACMPPLGTHCISCYAACHRSADASCRSTVRSKVVALLHAHFALLSRPSLSAAI